jgi:hypothetical protein
MAGLSTNAVDTYEVTTIREDLQEAYVSISPTETPFQSAIGSASGDNTYFEWPVVSLASVDSANRVLEGENAPANDAPTLAVRLGNYMQLSDKVAEVTSTAETVRGAGANVQRMAKQVALKMKELKRDIETMLCANVAANPGADATARATAGVLAFIKSGTTSGYPNAAAGNGTLRAITETILRTVVAECWDQGADPSIVLVNGAGKQKISTTFVGIATRYKNAEDKKVVAAIDVYVSDFGELQIVPSRFCSSRDALILDPNYARMRWLQKTNQTALAKTGHAERRLIAAEYGLQVDTETAHGVIADINWAL